MQMRSRHFFVPDRDAYPATEILHTPKMHTPFPPSWNTAYRILITRRVSIIIILSTMSMLEDDDADSLATPRPLQENEDDAIPSRVTLAEQMYSENGRSLKALALLSLGLKNDDDSPVFNTSILPWSAAVRPTALKMTAKELRKEIIRRCVAAENVLHAPRPNQWPVPKATEWLEKNPIVNEHEVAFIRATISHRITVAERIVPQPNAAQLPASSAVGTGNWVGKYPHLRLIHAIIDDNNIKSAYNSRLNLPSGRMAVENRRTQEAITSNVWYMVANKWNDPLFHPTTSVKDNHSDFARPIAIPFDAVASMVPATPEKVEEKWNTMNLTLKRIIQNWERSGQGYGGYVDVDESGEEDEEPGEEVDADNETFAFECLEGRSQVALDSRSNFFDGKNMYLLYLWDVLEEHGLTQSTMQQLLDGVGCANGSEGVPSTIGGKRSLDEDSSLGSSKKSRGKHNNEVDAFKQLSGSIEKHSNSLVTAAKIAAAEQEKNRCEARLDGIRNRINSLRDTKRNMVIQMANPQVANNQVVTDTILGEIAGIDAEIKAKEEELNNLLCTPTKSNRSPH